MVRRTAAFKGLITTFLWFSFPAIPAGEARTGDPPAAVRSDPMPPQLKIRNQDAVLADAERLLKGVMEDPRLTQDWSIVKFPAQIKDIQQAFGALAELGFNKFDNFRKAKYLTETWDENSKAAVKSLIDLLIEKNRLSATYKTDDAITNTKSRYDKGTLEKSVVAAALAFVRAAQSDHSLLPPFPGAAPPAASPAPPPAPAAAAPVAAPIPAPATATLPIIRPIPMPPQDTPPREMYPAIHIIHSLYRTVEDNIRKMDGILNGLVDRHYNSDDDMKQKLTGWRRECEDIRIAMANAQTQNKKQTAFSGSRTQKLNADDLLARMTLYLRQKWEHEKTTLGGLWGEIREEIARVEGLSLTGRAKERRDSALSEYKTEFTGQKRKNVEDKHTSLDDLTAVLNDLPKDQFDPLVPTIPEARDLLARLRRFKIEPEIPAAPTRRIAQTGRPAEVIITADTPTQWAGPMTTTASLSCGTGVHNKVHVDLNEILSSNLTEIFHTTVMQHHDREYLMVPLHAPLDMLADGGVRHVALLEEARRTVYLNEKGDLVAEADALEEGKPKAGIRAVNAGNIFLYLNQGGKILDASEADVKTSGVQRINIGMYTLEETTFRSRVRRNYRVVDATITDDRYLDYLRGYMPGQKAWESEWKKAGILKGVRRTDTHVTSITFDIGSRAIYHGEGEHTFYTPYLKHEPEMPDPSAVASP